MVAPAYLIGGGLVVLAGAYEAFKHFGHSGKKHTPEIAPAPDGHPDAGASAAQVGVPGAASPPDGSGVGIVPHPAAPTPGHPITGRVAGIDPAFLAKHPGWIGWHKGMPHPKESRQKPLPPGQRVPVTHTGALLAGGKPVLSGDAAIDLAHVLAWHGYRKSDVPLYKLAQKKLGVQPDGLPGAATMNALQGYLAPKGIPMPSVQTFSFTAFDGLGGPLMKDWTATA
jgi:hypothetical protein